MNEVLVASTKPATETGLERLADAAVASGLLAMACRGQAVELGHLGPVVWGGSTLWFQARRAEGPGGGRGGKGHRVRSHAEMDRGRETRI
jgi:hypothetical protein